MKKKIIVFSGICVLLFASVVCVQAKGLTTKLFVNERGEKVEYSYFEDSEEEIIKTIESEGVSTFENKDIPDNPKIGDVFKNGNTYERVIAVSKDGAFVSEVVEK